MCVNLRLATEMLCLASHWNQRPFHWISSVFSSLSLYFACMRRKQSFNLASRMTGVEDTCQTLTAILFLVKVNQYLKKLAFTSI